ncbi:MAG: class I SAM-dependent methyltransferase [Acidimicrobiales bacterium]|jgi:SAM-dependent methyltransferase
MTDSPDAGRALSFGAVTHLIRERVPGKVVAAELDARMRAVLVRRNPGVLAVGARAEALPFVDDSFDAVAVSSAWHWMDLALTVPEAARVLRPGGRLGVLWDGPARDVEWVAELLDPRRDQIRPASDHADRHRLELPTWSMPMTRDELAGLASTYSAVITRAAEEQAETLRRVERVATDHAGFGSGTTVQLPMRCRCWRATRG